MKSLSPSFSRRLETKLTCCSFLHLSLQLFATAAVKVAETAKPDQAALDQVDKPAPAGEWKGADGQT